MHINSSSCRRVVVSTLLHIRRAAAFVSAGDHVLLESQDFACVYNPKQITIRTRASEKESYDSAPVTLTPELLAEIRYRVPALLTVPTSNYLTRLAFTR